MRLQVMISAMSGNHEHSDPPGEKPSTPPGGEPERGKTISASPPPTDDLDSEWDSSPAERPPKSRGKAERSPGRGRRPYQSAAADDRGRGNRRREHLARGCATRGRVAGSKAAVSPIPPAAAVRPKPVPYPPRRRRKTARRTKPAAEKPRGAEPAVAKARQSLRQPHARRKSPARPTVSPRAAVIGGRAKPQKNPFTSSHNARAADYGLRLPLR